MPSKLRDRAMQRALMQFFKPENYFEVRRALQQAGRQRPDRRRLRLPDSLQAAARGIVYNDAAAPTPP